MTTQLARDGFYVQFADTHDAIQPDEFYDVLPPTDPEHAHLAEAFPALQPIP